MPAYEYQCQACDHRFERRQKMSDAEVENCPECGGAVKRLISGGAGVIAKGAIGATPTCESGACCMPELGCGNGCCCGH